MRASVSRDAGLPRWRVLALALLYCESDQLAEARVQFERFAVDGFDLPLDSDWAGSMFLLAEVCSALRDRARLRSCMRSSGRLPSKSELWGFVRCVGSLGHPAGVLAACLQHWDDAERHFEHAVAMNDRLGARPAAVRTRRAYAAMLLERNAPGDQPRAADLITAALAETEQLDMPAEAAKLQRLRERPHSASSRLFRRSPGGTGPLGIVDVVTRARLS